MSSAFKLRITRGDIQTLKNYHWLNDEVINFYMNLLVERSKKQGYPALHALSTFFYPKLKSGGYQAVKRWTKGVNLFDQELVLVPIHRKVHWSLVVMDLRKSVLNIWILWDKKATGSVRFFFSIYRTKARPKEIQISIS